MNQRCKCGGRMASQPNVYDPRTGETVNVFECDNPECQRRVERRARRSPLYWATQPTMVLIAVATNGKDRR